jgi:hypothetical protein
MSEFKFHHLCVGYIQQIGMHCSLIFLKTCRALGYPTSYSISSTVFAIRVTSITAAYQPIPPTPISPHPPYSCPTLPSSSPGLSSLSPSHTTLLRSPISSFPVLPSPLPTQSTGLLQSYRLPLLATLQLLSLCSHRGASPAGSGIGSSTETRRSTCAVEPRHATSFHQLSSWDARRGCATAAKGSGSERMLDVRRWWEGGGPSGAGMSRLCGDRERDRD